MQFICTVAHINNPFLRTAEWNAIVPTHCDLVTHSLSDGLWVVPSYWCYANKTGMNIHVQLRSGHIFSLLLGT